MLRHVSLAVLALLFTAALAAGEASLLNGQVFDIEIIEKGHAQKMKMLFKADHVALGSSKEDGKTVASVVSTVKRGADGKSVQFSATFQDMGNVVISGMVSGDKLKGDFSIPGMGKLPVTGSRATPVAEAGDMNKAKELLRARKPKEAIPVLVQIIEARRDKLEESSYALTRLVECFQLLKGDAASEKRYAGLAAKYLSTPPALDGAALPVADQVMEDLLWKSWVPGQETRITVRIGRVERKSRIQDGQRKQTVEMNLVLGGAGPGLKGAAGDQASLVAQAGDQQFTGRIVTHSHASDGQVSASLSFEDVPATVLRFNGISGTVTLTQPKQVEETTVALRKDATWQAGERTATITDVRTRGRAVTVFFQLVGGERQQFSGSGTSMRSGQDTASPYWLIAADGRAVYPDLTKESSSNGTTQFELGFNNADKAEKLCISQVVAVSQREIPIVLKDVDLP